VAHAYLGIEPETVWMIVTQHLPMLRNQLRALIASVSDETPGADLVV
jgi:uncharacterized protein with HEPN domain